MPKGVHNSSSDMDLVLGHEMQIRIHVPSSGGLHTGDRHVAEAKALMIRTVEEASFGGLPFYQKRQELTDGTIITARLIHGVQQVDVYLQKQREDVSTEGIFVFKPKVGYPKAIISLNEDEVDGIELKWGDNIRAGNFHCQDIQENDMLLSVKFNDSSTYAEGAAASNIANTDVYVSGFILVEAPSKVIGACLVVDDIFCFAINTATAIEFYSHPVITVDYSHNPSTPLIQWDDCIKVHTITFLSYTTTNNVTTPCTFNLAGTKGRVGALLGVKSSSGTLNIQDYWDLTLSVSNGDLTVSSVHSSKEHSYYYQQVTNDATQQGSPPPVDEERLYAGEMYYFATFQPYYDEYMDNKTDYYYSNPDVMMTTIMDWDGTTIEPLVTTEKKTHSLGTIQNLCPVGVALKEGYIISGTATENAAVATGFLSFIENQSPQACSVGSSSVSTPVKNTIAWSWEGKLDLDKRDYIKYDLKFTGSIEELNTEKASPHVQNWLYYGQVNCYDAQFYIYEEYHEPTDTTAYFIRLNPPHPVQPRVETKSGTSEKIAETKDIAEFNLRESVAIVGHKKDPSKVTSLQWENPRSSTPFFDTSPDSTWGGPDYTLHGDCYITFETAGGSIDVPGLLAKHGDVDDQVNCIYDAPMIITNPINNYTSANFPNHPPSSGDSNLSVRMLSHEKGYTLYSMTDYYVNKNEDSFTGSGSIKTVLTLYNHALDSHIDVLARYNALLSSDSRTSHLDQLEATRVGGNLPHYLHAAGVINDIPVPELIL